MSRPLLSHTALRWVLQKRPSSLQAEAPLSSQLCHLPTRLCTAPALISAGFELGIGASAYLITGNGALVAHLSANIADDCGEGGTPQHEIFAELAELGAVL